MHKTAYIIVGCGLFLLSGCSAFAPFVDARREAGQVQPVGSSTDDNPVICYGFADMEEVDRLAQNECAKTGRVAVFVRKENFNCSLLMPQKAIYRCEKTDKPVLPYQGSCPTTEAIN